MSRERRKADAAVDKKLTGLSAVASRLGAFRPAHEVLVQVRAVPTIFPWVNRVSKVGGWPTARFTLLHGESANGKTEMALGLGMSFLARGHFFAHVDAEQTTPIDWPRMLMGPLADSPGYVAMRPETYEQTRAEVRRFCTTIAEARIKRELEPGTTGLILVDSIRKLVPKNIWDELAKADPKADAKEPTVRASRGGRWAKPKKGIDGMGGRAGQIKAALNAAWVDELIPLLAQTDCAMAVIARETFDDEGEIKIGGGRALNYEASLRVRVELDGLITNGAEERSNEIIYGERRAVVIHKTKLAGREERWPTAYYHASNGRLEGVPAGFDRHRDLLELGLSLGAVTQKSGGHFSLGDAHLGQGANKVVQRLHRESDLLARLELAVESMDDAPAVRVSAPPT